MRSIRLRPRTSWASPGTRNAFRTALRSSEPHQGSRRKGRCESRRAVPLSESGFFTRQEECQLANTRRRKQDDRHHQKPRKCYPAVMGLPLRDCPMGRRAPPDFARYAPTIPGSSKQATIRRARSRRWRRQCSHECRLCRGHASSELHWLRHRRRDPG